MTPEHFIKTDPKTGNGVAYTASEFATAKAFTPCRRSKDELLADIVARDVRIKSQGLSVALPLETSSVRTLLANIVATNAELRRQGADGIDDRNQAMTLEFLNYHNLMEWPS